MLRAVGLLICLAMCFPGEAHGQVQMFQVSINPQVSLVSLSADQFMNHPGTVGNLNFFDSEWRAVSNTSAGASVAFTAGPFINTSNNTYMRDVQLRLRQLNNDPGATWSYDDRAERTRYANGKMIADATMSSTSAGGANVKIRVRFITGANPAGTLPAGNYVTTVYGTITAN